MVALGPVVVCQLLAGADETRRADPDGLVDHLKPAVRPARVVDQARDVAADRGVAAPAPVDAEHPDTALLQIARFARRALRVEDQLARIVDDACVLADALAGKHAVAVNPGSLADDSWKFRFTHGCKLTLNGICPTDVLIILAGLPGTGKTAIARLLARRFDAVHVRIDSIEQAIRDSGVLVVSLDDAGYRAAYAVADDNLRLGRTVIADSVNPIDVTRTAWRDVARHCDVRAVEIEVTCSDADEHRRRVETRSADIPGHRLPTWAEVVARNYDPWDRPRTVVDTAQRTPAQAVEGLIAAIDELQPPHHSNG